ncbi:MAG: GlsB/YeaQ/YmgE family stress response membrane protein [Armatimonadetes bacterium]|nr:GlsB/YeaQ/YmgE family stress response membrane protein [Armatimonadota bacterium]
MDLIGFAIIGLIAGFLAKAIMPGKAKEPEGCFLTMLLGVGGAIVAGVIAWMLGWSTGGSLFGSITAATLGAVLIIWLLRKFGK